MCPKLHVDFVSCQRAVPHRGFAFFHSQGSCFCFCLNFLILK
uniref:Uncharacterized protein n=1 Tax=Anguilla anguilla TaxID=7936 RepID=A0A0E9QUW1_ANGAN